MDEINKKLHEINKKLENKIEEINIKLHEINQKLENKKLEETNKKLEEINKKLEERDKQLAEICNKDPVSYTVSSSGLAATDSSSKKTDANARLRRFCMGQYYPTGKSHNGFPTFRKGKYYLYVDTDGNWTIGYKFDVDAAAAYIHQSDKNHTPSTPPRNGWKIWESDSLVLDTTCEVLPRSFVIYRLTCFDEDLPDQNTSNILGDYIPTGQFSNGFPIFNKGEYFLLVDTDANWKIISKSSDGDKKIYHPDKKPTPSTPPLVGWTFPQMAKPSPSVTVFPVIGSYAYEDHESQKLFFIKKS